MTTDIDMNGSGPTRPDLSSPPSAGEDAGDKSLSSGDPKWRIQSVRWDDALVNRLLSSIRANPDWASSIARGALTSIDPSGTARGKAPLSKTDAIREVTRALFEGDPEYDMDDVAVQKSLLVSVRNKLYKLQPLDEYLAAPDGKYSSVAGAARKEHVESVDQDTGPVGAVRRSLRVPLSKKYAEEVPESDASSSRASPRPARTGRGQALAAKGGVPRHAPAEATVRRPWRPPLPLRPQFVASYQPLAPVRTVADIRRTYFINEKAYLSASLDRLTREAEERSRLDDEHLRLLRLEIEAREREKDENSKRYESKAARLREKISNAEEEIKSNTTEASTASASTAQTTSSTPLISTSPSVLAPPTQNGIPRPLSTPA
ncbi:hypothetical protein DACRYDRAFT_20293 [Dacryopinax primogenitus]|uniref:Uncharacterized protein n=1 Tax=Dacryopinax primogenitus (strain DJM 731) TaxID=1858805 RepID=M5G2Z5_DACPD|nr:uncharacterized protein DACRYDRAFT_20293 [Dacryopinax primogenitus]EJU04601.1 hypothetical protein DACRYDRAFT_20293 [Dacryopinax primogenitus]